MKSEAKKIIIVGASSGMGRCIAIEYATQNARVGITARRAHLLADLQQQFPQNIFIESFDVTKDDIAQHFRTLIEKLGGCDLFILCAGAGYLNSQLDYSIEKQTIDLNVLAWTALADFAYLFFKEQRHGHLVAITSIAAIRGEGRAPAYNASKAYQAHYLEGLQKKSSHDRVHILVTDVQPGFVKTEEANGDRFWEASAEKAARQIVRTIKKRKKKVYITKRWWFIAQLLKILPQSMYNRI